MKKTSLSALAVILLTACGGATPAPVTVPPATPPAPAASAGATAAPPAKPDPFVLPAREPEPADAAPAGAVTFEAWLGARKTKGVAAAPATCAAYATRAPSKEETDSTKAFAERDPAKRDAMLAALGAMKDSMPVAVRAQRAELAPLECADGILDPMLEKLAKGPLPANEPADDVRVAIGLSLAGKLARTATTPPVMGAVADKEKVKAFVKGPLRTWMTEQAAAIEALSAGAAGLGGYARGVAAIEAGIADLRLVDKIRSAPVPKEWDRELKSVYEAALDEALEPRKARGRDAALVGMGDLARVGVFRDPRVDRARTLLTKLYGGRRIDALDALFLPRPLPLPVAETQQEIAADVVPPYWLDPKDKSWAMSPRFLARSVLRPVREHFRGTADVDPDLRTRYVRARFELGRTYWRRLDFIETAYAAKPSADPANRLLLALALDLAHGPNGAAEMMRASSPAALDLAHTEALDAIAGAGGPLAGLAAYDAAHLRALSPPSGSSAAYLRDVAERFRAAAGLLVEPAQKEAAAQRAKDIDATLSATDPRKL